MTPDDLPSLPVASILADAVRASRGGALVLTAPPGSGKTMLVPAAVLDDLPAPQRVVLIQPRRMAARAVARRIATLRRSQIGAEIGYQVRFDNRTTRDTRLHVVTTGILLRRLLDDIELTEVGAVVLDEFHERTVEMDLALGMLVRIHETLRPDLRIIVMSATLAAEPVAKLLGNCPILHAEGRRFPVSVRYQRRGEQKPPLDLLPTLVAEALRQTPGHILVFLPGVGEIIRAQDALAPLAKRENLALLPLFGDLPPEQQDRVLDDLGQRKLVLSTNVAETSLTIEGVTAVIDSGQVRQLRVSTSTGLPRLELVPISQASAEQRAGRAGRTAPGICWRLWDESSHRARPASDVPEILRSDLTEPLLQLLTHGERENFPWLDPPPADAIAGAQQLLRLLGALSKPSPSGSGSGEGALDVQPGASTTDGTDRLTSLGEELVRLPAHPRLGRLLLAGAQRGVLRETALAAALLSERNPFRAAERSARQPRVYGTLRSRSDIVTRVLALQSFHAGSSPTGESLPLNPGAARNVLRAADQLYRLAEFDRQPRAADPAQELMHALLEAFPDRLTKLRPGTQDRGLMVGGRGIRIDSSSLVRGEPLFLSIDLDDAGGEARARLVSAVERAWLPPDMLDSREELFFNPTRGQVEARQRTYWADLLIEETPIAISDTAAAADLLAKHSLQQFDRIAPAPDSPAGIFLARVRWLATALPELELPSLDEDSLRKMLPQLCHGRRSIDELRDADWLSLLQAHVGYDRLRDIDRLAPPELEVPSGNRHKLSYEAGKPPILAVRIQELFGMGETPRVAGGRFPVLLHLLGPNYRPQQVTDDLASFWKNGYPEIKKELRRRYPKHAWPDDPLTATPTRSGLQRSAPPKHNAP